MKLMQGEFAPMPATWSARWFWLRRNLTLFIPSGRMPGDTGEGYTLRREWGGWSVRPRSGWRRRRWSSLPLHYTRSIPAGDKMAAGDWALERMGL